MNEKIRNGGTPSIRNKKYPQILESLGWKRGKEHESNE